jgi:hypothetical protein
LLDNKIFLGCNYPIEALEALASSASMGYMHGSYATGARAAAMLLTSASIAALALKLDLCVDDLYLLILGQFCARVNTNPVYTVLHIF